MSVLYLVLPLALLVIAGAVLAFVWSARSGQYDDMETPAVRILRDEESRSTASSAPPRASGQPATQPQSRK